MKGWVSGTVHLFEQMPVSPPPCFLFTRDLHETRYCKHQKDLNGTLPTDTDKPLFKAHKHTERKQKEAQWED